MKKLTAAAIVISVGAALLFVPIAQALEPLPYSTLSPPGGQVYAPQAQWGIPWHMTGAPPRAVISVSVSTTNAVGSDGATLSDLNRVDHFLMAESSTDVGVYRGVSNRGPTLWPNVAGTYYWQVQARWTEYPPYPQAPVGHYAVSPIFTITIQAPQSTPTTAQPALDLSMRPTDARYYVRNLIRDKTGRRAQRLSYGCSRLSARSFRCRPSWYDRRYRYAGTATFRHFVASDGEVYASASFIGRRTSRACLKRVSAKRCARRVRWRM